jgi:hypothetical protein
MSGQSRRASFAEACLNVAVGYLVALASQMVILPMYGVQLTLAENAVIGFWFTLVSICRSYVLRRWFNGLMLRRAYGRGL